MAMQTLIIKRIAKIAFKSPIQIVTLYASLISNNALNLMIPWLLGVVIDSVLSSGNTRQIFFYSFIIIAISILRGGFAYVQTFLGEYIAQKTAYHLRNSLYAKLQILSFAFHDQNKTGDLMSRCTADVEAIRMFVQTGFLRAGQTILMLIGTYCILLITNWRLGLLTMIVLPIVVARSTIVNLRMRKLWTFIQESTGLMTAVLQENLSGIRVVKAFGAETFERKKFEKITNLVRTSSIAASRIQSSNTVFNILLFSATTGLILWYGSQEISQQRLSQGELASFIFYLGLVQMPIRMSGWILNSFSRATSAGQRVFSILDTLPPVMDSPNASKISKIKGDVKLNNISFGYTESNNVLSNISLEAKPGEKIALLGGPGSGKTSLVHLLPRFYDVTEGSIEIDRVNIKSVTLESLRENIGLVMQDVFIFSASIAENISYGIPNASIEEIRNASITAQLDKFINSLPNGYQTEIGERGITLSGGQKQRLSIARTLLLNPPILILDDTTSSVDAATENLLQNALEKVMQNRTVFIITNRLNSILEADKIFVLSKGSIVQKGTHKDLISQQGIYRDMYQIQFLDREI